MSTALQIIQVGDEAGVILPDDVIARWGLRVGDEVPLIPSGDGIALEFNSKRMGEVDEAAPR